MQRAPPELQPTAKQVLATVQAELPDLMALYAFGSRAMGGARADSDWDLAVLVPGLVPPLHLWALGQALASTLEAEVDLLDFRAASTVMQAQILQHGQRWWHRGSEVLLYEAAVLNDKLSLDEAKAPLVAAVLARGQVYGR